MRKKKLIEVALPLDAINAASSREKSIRHGHPSTLHLWWARRPLAAARAVIWASLVDDPSSHPEEFPTEEEQQRERERLFGILEKLVIWENSNNKEVLEEAKAEIMISTDGNPPELLDPFAGGGSIPLEGQRLGLKVHAHDLNPVAVMINKAMIEIPPLFANRPPVNPEARSKLGADHGWEGAAGLTEDVRYYGELLKQKAFEKIGHLYPKVKVPEEQGGGEATVIAWIWARTVKCPNPACGCDIPLSTSFVLSKKKGNEAWCKPIINNGRIHFEVLHGKCPKEKETNKVGRGAVFSCVACGEVTSDDYVKKEGKDNRIRKSMMAIVAEGDRKRLYLNPSIDESIENDEGMVDRIPMGEMSKNPRWFSPPAFGMYDYSSIFTHRQYHMLSTISDYIGELRSKIQKNASVCDGFRTESDIPLREGGRGSRAYAEAISVYLSFVLDKLVDYHSTICIWHTTRELISNAMRRQAIQMTWGFAECNPFCHSSGCIDNMIQWVAEGISNLPVNSKASVRQIDAQSVFEMNNLLVSTDPPYYDNIGYADLSDYFYVWMRKSNGSVYPELFQTMMVPKKDELVAVPFRFDGNESEAKAFFENGMFETCKHLWNYAKDDLPVTVYYAYKQNDKADDDAGTAISTGWETMLSSLVKAGFIITGTWPMRTELVTALKGNVNALASSIVLVCRKRPGDALSTTRRNLVNELKRELRPALKHLQQSNIAPVDLAQSAIGPGMAVFSKYSQVLEADGTPMTVRSALQIINQELDIYFNEQDGELDRDSRFCVDLYTQCAFNDIKFGDADTLARAKNTSVSALEARGVVYAKKGVVHLLERKDIPEKVNTNESMIWLLTQQLTHAMETGGVEACAKIVFSLKGFTNVENAKSLAYRLYTIAERKGWAQEAYAYNSLVISWQDIQSRAAQMTDVEVKQMTLFD